MATTADYAKLGQTSYQAEVRYSDGHDPSVHHPALPQPQEFPDSDAAKAWVARQLRQLGTPERGCFYGEVQRGCYQDASYDDRGQFSGAAPRDLGAPGARPLPGAGLPGRRRPPGRLGRGRGR
jgi:hypothetical protein